MIKRFSGNRLWILYLCTAFILVWVLYAIAIKPIIGQWRDIDQRIDIAKEKLEQSLVLMQDKKDIDDEYSLYESRLSSRGSDEQEMAYQRSG